MIASTQVANNEIFAFIATLDFKLLSHKVFKKIANFLGKLLQNYKQMECKIFRILLKRVTRVIFSEFY